MKWTIGDIKRDSRSLDYSSYDIGKRCYIAENMLGT